MRAVGAAIVLLLLGGLSARAAKAQASASVSPAEMQELTGSFNTLFAAMKDGNVAVIEKHFSGTMLTEYRKLLEQNEDYPAFLRNYYKGASFRIARVTPAEDGEVVVDVAIQLDSGSTSITRLATKRFASSAELWKVTAVANDDRAVTHK
jgi:hypothetical protein